MNRYKNNPILGKNDVMPSQPEAKVLGAFNPGATLYNDEIILLLRVPETFIEKEGHVCIPYYEMVADVAKLRLSYIPKNDPDLKIKDTRAFVYKGIEYPSTVSHLRIARSKDGYSFIVDEKPFIKPEREYELLGVEDARITKIDDVYYINYTGVSKDGFVTVLGTTKDFKSFDRKGIIFPPLNKDVSIFEEKINGHYYALHRPHNQWFGKPSIWISSSPDLIHWGNHKCIVRPEEGSRYENVKIGGGAAPIKTNEGWLEIYHAVGNLYAPDKEVYSLGLLLMDGNDPYKILKKSNQPILLPEMEYEKNGFVENVVFSNGIITRNNGQVLIYYGACDEYVAVIETHVDTLISKLKKQ